MVVVSYESAMVERGELIGERSFVDSWPLELVPHAGGLRGVYAPRGYSDILVLEQLDGAGNKISDRLDVYAKRSGTG